MTLGVRAFISLGVACPDIFRKISVFVELTKQFYDLQIQAQAIGVCLSILQQICFQEGLPVQIL